jgi:hypothetical protein
MTAHTVDVRIGVSSETGADQWAWAVSSLDGGAELQLWSGSATAIGDRALAVLIGLVRQARRRNADVRWCDDPSTLERALRSRGIPPALIAGH